jgi:hypothetical protein
MSVTSPSGERTRWSERDTARSLAVREQGFYEVRDGGAVAATRIIAVNRDAAESELGSFAPEEFVRTVAPAVTASAATNVASTLSVEEREQRQRLWWYVLLGAILILAVESVLSNRLSRTARPDGATVGRIDHA